MSESPTALLTGCASGIAAQLVRALARDGYRLMATDLDSEALSARAREADWDPNQVRLHKLDVRDFQAWTAVLDMVVETWGRVDLLVNTAGYLYPGYVHELDPGQLDLHLDVNVKGVVLGVRAVSPRMVRQGSGHIINFASLAGVAAAPGLSLYSASKFAVRGFSHAVAMELAPHGIAVTVICPDAVATPMLERQVDHPEAAMSFTRHPALTPEQVAAVVVGKVLRTRPLETAIPTSRGWMARFAAAFPAVAAAFTPKYMAKGWARQEALKERRNSG